MDKSVCIKDPYAKSCILKSDSEEEIRLKSSISPKSPKSITKKLRSLLRKRSSRKIAYFMKKTESKRRSVFLNIVCSDSGVCVAFGKEINKIKKHFEDFSNFNLLTRLNRKGTMSSNGFISELTFEKSGYIANAILKSTKTVSYGSADSLLYEAIVGFFLNKMSLIYPCFIETYGLYKYNPSTYSYLESNTGIIDPNLISSDKNSLVKHQIDDYLMSNICEPDNIHYSVLIQNLTNAKTLREMLLNDPSFLDEDLMCVLAQVYLPLADMCDFFTHYDLHLDNILLYEPVPGKCIDFFYALDLDEVMFKCKYIVKIIDYGRSFFFDSSNPSLSSININDILIRLGCDPILSGFQYFGKPDYASYYISSYTRNMSHDLRALNDIKSYKNLKSNKTKKVKTLSERLSANYTLNNFFNALHYKRTYGTKEVTLSEPGIIQNVKDAAAYIVDIINSNEFQLENNSYYNSVPILGELSIDLYEKTPTGFIAK